MSSTDLFPLQQQFRHEDDVRYGDSIKIPLPPSQHQFLLKISHVNSPVGFSNNGHDRPTCPTSASRGRSCGLYGQVNNPQSKPPSSKNKLNLPCNSWVYCYRKIIQCCTNTWIRFTATTKDFFFPNTGQTSVLCFLYSTAFWPQLKTLIN